MKFLKKDKLQQMCRNSLRTLPLLVKVTTRYPDIPFSRRHAFRMRHCEGGWMLLRSEESATSADASRSLFLSMPPDFASLFFPPLSSEYNLLRLSRKFYEARVGTSKLEECVIFLFL